MNSLYYLYKFTLYRKPGEERRDDREELGRTELTDNVIT